MEIYNVYSTNAWEEKSSREDCGSFSTIFKARGQVEMEILDKKEKVIIEKVEIDKKGSNVKFEVYSCESGLEEKNEASNLEIGMYSRNAMLVEKLNEKYEDEKIDFFGNDEFEAFYGTVDSFQLDSDNSIYVTLIDQDDIYFDVDIKYTSVNLSELN